MAVPACLNSPPNHALRAADAHPISGSARLEHSSLYLFGFFLLLFARSLPVVFVPGHVLLHVAVHDARQPVLLAHVAVILRLEGGIRSGQEFENK